METFLELVNRWANNLTIRILGIAGASKETLDNVAEGFNNQEAATTEAQRKAKQKYQWIKWVIVTALILSAFFVFLKIKQLTSKR